MSWLGEKGQVSTEYLVITAFLLAVIGIIFSYALVTLSENAKLSRVDDAVDTLANAANQVSALGPGNTVYVNVDVPNDIYSASASNYEIKYVVTVIGGHSDVWERTKNPITPTTLPTTAGLYVIKVEMADENVVFTQV